ncbi:MULTISPECIES: 4'-phosphopantetheinyl transferase superfamily protein [unclassified Pseudomonas]|uniref:4'-phosphopantetheinyl transferase family protein n=1 Tax=unclassified Pseudomonas TaxID=196821 RepID=UPI00244CA72B|nr:MULTISPECIES: 4'-phosphopantetheinyl transferase superfamily protein [unclassified Pseudomonas]MDH0896159.1 4'-phosphopantetheinyl transferase superfamily protein [Pseudomonas sp. GD03875]MDH1066017.1 4'-phosphopantetheinyl transferase superfamily protein [Pseudomonas sp. GD03985]
MRFCQRPGPEYRVSLPGCVVMGTRFDHRLLGAGCIDRSGIPLPPAIRRSVPRRQAEFVAGRLCAKEALERLTGTPAIPPIGEDRAPRWPEAVCGAITHNRHRALAMVARRNDYLALGVDIESLIDDALVDELAGELLTQGERERFLSLPKEQRAHLLTLTFSLKESLYKALHPLTGRQFYFEHAELLAWSADGRARLRLLCWLDERFPENTEIDGRFCMIEDDLLSYVAIANSRGALGLAPC